MSGQRADRPFIIDGVAHGYDFGVDNRADGVTIAQIERFGRFVHQMGHMATESRKAGYCLTYEEFVARWDPEDLAHALFVESGVDMAVYHAVEISHYYKDGVSRLDTGLKMKALAPDRVLVYGYVDTFGDRSRAFDQMEKGAEQGVSGFKFYPSNGFYDRDANRLVTMFYDTPDQAYKYFEKAQSLGVKHLAFHKAQPVGPGPTGAVAVEDVSTAAMAFPDLTFEIVHDGWAFLEQAALQLKLHSNIYANLECVDNLIVRAPRRFAQILGTLLDMNAEDRLLFATGCAVNHPTPIIDAFMDFEMPIDLVEGFGYRQLTPELKAKILGGNMARLHGVDIESVKQKIKNDRWSQARAQYVAQGGGLPWAAHRARLAGRGARAHETGIGIVG